LPVRQRKDPIRMRISGSLLLIALVLSLAPGASLAAEAPTRDEYVTRLEAICQPRVEATQRAMKGARRDLHAERNAVAAGKFERGSRFFSDTIDRMGGVPRPSADLARLKTWFGYLGEQERYLGKIIADLRSNQPIKAGRSISRFIHNGNLANNTVLAFGFNYCFFKYSRFG
jgi:hypothetical protein